MPSRLLRPLLVLSFVAGVGALPVASYAPRPHATVRTMAVRAGETLSSSNDFRMLGVVWPKGDAAPSSVKVRTSRDGKHFTRWQSLEISPDEAPDPNSAEAHNLGTDPMWVGHARYAQVRWTGHLSSRAQLATIDPGPDPAKPASVAQATPSQPPIITRAEWGADESIRKCCPEYAEPLKMVFIHHTVTGNSYAESDSAAIVRSIYVYHVQTNGWNDIGYNFLVDRYGQIFEGRYGGMTRALIGAHSLGFNTHSAGIAVIGTFDTVTPPSAAIASLQRIAAWRMDVAHIDPNTSVVMTSGGNPRYPAGTNVSLNTISGHRDVYDTDCPGSAFYSQLPSLRSAVAKLGDPKVYYPRLSRSTITPNADGIADGTTLTARFSSSVSWTTSVVSSSGKTWSTASGSGSSLSASWGGRNGSSFAPQGGYRFTINAHNGHGTMDTVSVPFTLLRFPSMRQTIAERAPASANTWRWYLRNATTGGSPNTSFNYGNPRLGDYPVAGDWDGNGTTTPGIVRPVDGQLVWYLRNSNSPGDPSITPFAYGSVADGDFPVVGDWNGNGKSTIGVARPDGANITWLLRNSNSAGSPDATFNYGKTDAGYPVTGDWNSDHMTSASFAAVDLTNGNWSWNENNVNGTGAAAVPFSYGSLKLGDRPVTGDWNGDGTTSIGVVRPGSNGQFTWLLRNVNLSGSPDIASFQYGAAHTDIPVTGDWDGDVLHRETVGIVRAVKT